jgi:hypothetical protein
LKLREKIRIEVYVPDLLSASYRNLAKAFEEEFTYSFGGCTVIRGIDGNYLSQAGEIIPDRINLIYTDLPFSLTDNFGIVEKYVAELKQTAIEALEEEAILIAVKEIYHIE